MLIDSIIHAQQGCDSDMMFLVSKFSGILKNYARKLNYEDAEQDLTADFRDIYFDGCIHLWLFGK